MPNTIPDHVRDFLKERLVEQFERAMYCGCLRPSTPGRATYALLVSPPCFRLIEFDGRDA
jgi:hypothetical protein